MPIALHPAQLPVQAAAPLSAIVRGAASASPTAPTPCADWDLAALVRHQLYWAPFLAAAGRRTVPTPVAPTEAEVSLEGWPDALDAARTDVVTAWSEPAAWAGTTVLGGPDELPAPMIGGMVLGELVVHGWDLARAVGVRPEWSAELLQVVHSEMVGITPQGREMGIFGPEVPWPADAPLLDRIVALTGRDPHWAP